MARAEEPIKVSVSSGEALEALRVAQDLVVTSDLSHLARLPGGIHLGRRGDRYEVTWTDVDGNPDAAGNPATYTGSGDSIMEALSATIDCVMDATNRTE